MLISSITVAQSVRAIPFWGVRPFALPMQPTLSFEPGLTAAQADVFRAGGGSQRGVIALEPIAGTDHFVLKDLTLPPLSTAVYRLTQENPLALVQQEVDILTRVAVRRGATTRMNRQARAFGRGLVSFPRLEAMLKLLIRELGNLEGRAPLIIDNGPRMLTHLSMAAAKAGAQVLVKEPDAIAAKRHGEITQRELPPAWAKRIAYAQHAEEIDRQLAAEIVFWTSPDPGMLDTKVLASRGFKYSDPYEYLGRDVRPGGLLAIQTCDSAFCHHPYHPRRWSRLAATVLFENSLILPTHYVMPDHAPLGNFLLILRRNPS